MAQLSSEAELNFYEGLLRPTLSEIGEMKCKPPYDDGGIIISPNKDFRLTQLYEYFEAEIENNLGLYDSEKLRNNHLERYLKKAREYWERFDKELKDYLADEPKMYWQLPNAYLNLRFVGKLIRKLSSFNDILVRVETKSFNAKLNKNQLKKLLSLIDDIGLFDQKISQVNLQKLLKGANEETYKITNNQNLAHLFRCLSSGGYITTNWQSVIEKNKCFKGKKGRDLTAKNLSASLNGVSLKSEVSKKINNTVASLNKS